MIQVHVMVHQVAVKVGDAKFRAGRRLGECGAAESSNMTSSLMNISLELSPEPEEYRLGSTLMMAAVARDGDDFSSSSSSSK